MSKIALEDIFLLGEKVDLALREALRLRRDQKALVGNEHLFLCYALLTSDLSSYAKVDVTAQNFRQIPVLARFKDTSLKGWFNRVKVEYNFTKRSLQWRVNRKEKKRLGEQLSRNDNLIHGLNKRAYSHNFIPNLSSVFIKNTSKNRSLRKHFLRSLRGQGVKKDFAEAIANFFPVSHLELFEYLRDHPITGVEVKTVCTNLQALMSDPLLSALVREASPDLVFIQHGGFYGLKDSLPHKIERDGCDQMFFWGVGQQNVFPTRWEIQQNKTSQCGIGERGMEVIFLIGRKSESLENWKRSARALQEKFGLSVTIALHPRAKEFREEKNCVLGIDDCERLQFGISVFDSANHTGLYNQILFRKPLLILESSDVTAQNPLAEHFLYLLRKSGILIEGKLLPTKIKKYRQLGPLRYSEYFRKNSVEVFDYLENLPKIEELFPAGKSLTK